MTVLIRIRAQYIYFIMSLKDRIRSKLKLKPQHQTFDESSLSVQLRGVHSLTQLQAIQLVVGCPLRIQLQCTWYNKTQTNIEEIKGVSSNYYQPCLVDINTIVRVQITPTSDAAQYIGMPIIKDVGPITIASQTQKEAQALYQMGKASFHVDIKEAWADITHYKGIENAMLTIQSNHTLTLVRNKDSLLFSGEIGTEWPNVECNRNISNEITICFGPKEKCVLRMSNHKIRDTFCLLFKIIAANREHQLQAICLQEEDMQNQEKQLECIELIQQTTGKQQIQKQENSDKQQISLQKDKLMESLSEFESPLKLRKSEITEKRENNDLRIIKSSEVLFGEEYCERNINESTIKNQANTSSSQQKSKTPKYTVSEVIQLTQLKKDLKIAERSLLSEQKNAEKYKFQSKNLQEKLTSQKQLMSNLQKNYFQLQATNKEINEKNGQLQIKLAQFQKQTSYFKKQNTLQKIKEQQFICTITDLKNKIQNLQSQIKQKNQEQLNKLILLNKKTHEIIPSQINQLKDKIQYLKNVNDQREQQMINLKNNKEKLEAQIKRLNVKYSSLSNELQLKNQQEIKNPIQKQIPLRKKNIEQILQRNECDEEKKLLKKKIHQLSEQIQTVKAIILKDKKPNSRTFLKLQLVEVKSLVKRLTQQLSEKDMAFNNIKQIAKKIGKIIQQCEICKIKLNQI